MTRRDTTSPRRMVWLCAHVALGVHASSAAISSPVAISRAGMSARTAEELLAILEKLVCGEASINAAWRIGKDLTELQRFRDHMREASPLTTTAQRETADLFSAFGSDAYGAARNRKSMSGPKFVR